MLLKSKLTCKDKLLKNSNAIFTASNLHVDIPFSQIQAPTFNKIPTSQKSIIHDNTQIKKAWLLCQLNKLIQKLIKSLLPN